MKEIDLMAHDMDMQYFRDIPWCVKLIDNPAFQAMPTFSREPKISTEDSLIAQTLKTQCTINAWLSLFKRSPGQVVAIEEVRVLASLKPGLNGYPHICHGGVIAMLMDEASGLLLSANEAKRNKASNAINGNTVTARLNLEFVKPVVTPQVVLVTATFRGKQGRKFSVDARIEDSAGVMLARAESLWVLVDADKSRL